MHDWEQICETHGPLVWSTVYRVLNDHTRALDCYQDVFLEAFERTADREVRDWPSLLRWLSVRRAIDRLRQRSRTDGKRVTSPDLSNSVVVADGPVETARLNLFSATWVCLQRGREVAGGESVVVSAEDEEDGGSEVEPASTGPDVEATHAALASAAAVAQSDPNPSG